MKFSFNFLILLSFILIFSGCTKKAGTTSSKIKIFGSKAFSAANLASKANNGLMLYGTGSNGKTFAKRINNDSIDLVFPNGVWNFYVVAWEIAGGEALDTGLRGAVTCGKALGVNLNGAEASINLTLSNNNCDQNFHPRVENVVGVNKLANFRAFSCKNLAGISSVANSNLCNYQSGVVDNKGYATHIRIAVPEYSNFSGGPPNGGVAMVSKCFAIESGMTSAINPSDSAIYTTINMPKAGLNGFQVDAQIFYTKEGCDLGKGFTTISLGNSTKKLNFETVSGGVQSTDEYFLETDRAPVCQGPRLDPSFFASGMGTAGLPYTICNNAQFQQIHTLYNDGTYPTHNKSFELLSNLDFNFNTISPIGDTAPAITTSFTGNFNGNHHFIERFKMHCSPFAANATDVGLFRSVFGGSFSNFVINKGLIECDEATAFFFDKIGLVAGTASNAKFTNVKVFGHASARNYVGGLVGESLNNSTFNDVHFEGGVSGASLVGGIAGQVLGNISHTFLSKSSFHGDARARCNSGTCDSFVGGLIGRATYSTNSGTISECIVKNKTIEGSKIIGGAVGKTTLVNIQDSIVTGALISSAYTDGSTSFVDMGGLAGQANQGDFSRNLVIPKRKTYRDSIDSTEGSILGSFGGGATPTYSINSVKPGRNFSLSNGSSAFAINLQAVATQSQIEDDSYYYSTSFAVDYPAWHWPATDAGVGRDIPRLAWELAKENDIPYLKRECSGLYTTPAGNGTAVNPFTICSVAQFNSMEAGPYYILKKDLYFPLAPVSMKPSGVYHFDGDENSLYDVIVDASAVGNSGLFQELLSGSTVSDLFIVFGELFGSNDYVATGNMSVGLLAGKNWGSITDITTIESGINFFGLDLDMSGSPLTFFAGGLVGVNGTGASISYSEVDTSIGIMAPKNTSVDILILGGIAAINDGSINITSVYGEVDRSLGTMNLGSSPSDPGGCSILAHKGKYYYNSSDTFVHYCNGTNFVTLTTPMRNSEKIAGAVGENNGVLSEITYQGSIRINDLGTNTDGSLAPFVAVNTGTIADAHVRAQFNSDRGTVEKVVYTNTGSISRLVFEPEMLTGFNYSTGLIFSGGTLVENICRYTLPGSNCLDSDTEFYSYVSPTLTLNSVPYNWNTGIDFLDTNIIWIYRGGKIDLNRTGGNFESLGLGF